MRAVLVCKACLLGIGGPVQCFDATRSMFSYCISTRILGLGAKRSVAGEEGSHRVWYLACRIVCCV